MGNELTGNVLKDLLGNPLLTDMCQKDMLLDNIVDNYGANTH
jgi:hypothetical protein